MKDNLIELENIYFSYPDKDVFKNLNLSIKENEFFSIIGPSGCGKSTLLYLIGGHLKPTSGKIKFNINITLNGNKREIVTIFQNDYLFPHLNVYNNIDLALSLREKSIKNRENIIKEFSEKFNISQLLSRRIDEISGGERQRSAIVRSLVLKPKILLLDEPLSSLDVNLRKSLRRQLKKIQKETKSTFIYVTHNQEEAFSMSDRVAIFNRDGSIQQIDKPEEVYKKPANEFVAGFIGMDNLLEIKKIKNHELYISKNFYFKYSKNINGNIRYIGIHSSDIIIETNKNLNYNNSYIAKIVDIEFHGPFSIIHLKVNNSVFLYSRVFENNLYNIGQEVKIYIKNIILF